MKKLQFNLNGKIEFIDEEGQLGTSLIQDCKEDFFLVTIPLKCYQKRLLNVGSIVTGVYYDKDGKVYMFESKVLERIVQNIPMYKLSIPEELEKIQRRDNVRIQVTIPIKYIQLTPETESHSVEEILKEYDLDSSENWETGAINDLSGGGINIRTESPVDLENILVYVDAEGLQLTLKGKVMRQYTKITYNRIAYHMGIKFVDVSEQERDKIIGFIFRMFRDRKKKGVGL